MWYPSIWEYFEKYGSCQMPNVLKFFFNNHLYFKRNSKNKVWKRAIFEQSLVISLKKLYSLCICSPSSMVLIVLDCLAICVSTANTSPSELCNFRLGIFVVVLFCSVLFLIFVVLYNFLFFIIYIFSEKIIQKSESKLSSKYKASSSPPHLTLLPSRSYKVIAATTKTKTTSINCKRLQTEWILTKNKLLVNK